MGFLPRQSERDLDVGNGAWGIECKIARPFGDNDAAAENWSVNLLHPYPGNESLIGDGMKLRDLQGFERKGLLVFGFEHDPAQVSLDPLVDSFELVATRVCEVPLGGRVEEVRRGLVPSRAPSTALHRVGGATMRTFRSTGGRR